MGVGAREGSRGSCTLLCPVQRGRGVPGERGGQEEQGAGPAGTRQCRQHCSLPAPLHASLCPSCEGRGFCEGLEAEKQQAGPMCSVPALQSGSAPLSSNTNGLVAAYCTVSQRHGGPLSPFSGRSPLPPPPPLPFAPTAGTPQTMVTREQTHHFLQVGHGSSVPSTWDRADSGSRSRQTASASALGVMESRASQGSLPLCMQTMHQRPHATTAQISRESESQ